MLNLGLYFILGFYKYKQKVQIHVIMPLFGTATLPPSHPTLF